MRDLKALALGLILTFVSLTGAFAQCGTQAPANKFCGNDTGSAALATWKSIPAGALTAIAGGTVLGNPTGALAVPVATTAPVLGIPGTSTGQVGLAGLSSGTAILRAQSAAGSAVSLLPTVAGTLVGSAALPIVTDPVTGVVSISAPYTTLVANNGGIVYSGATNLAILAGTATTRQMLQSGASSAPAWSTATWPATTTINQLLYSSSANVVAGLATANGGILNTSGTGVPSITPTPTLGVAGSVVGSLAFQNATSGTITFTPVTGALGSVAIAIPAVSGTLAVSASAPVTLSAAGAIACPTCVTASGGGAITGTAPIAVSAAGVVSINAPYVSLTANNGGIVYSGATNLAILNGTATGRQMLQSGVSTTPAWSTTTWPATTTINRILYSSAASVVGEITTANGGLLNTNSTGVPSVTATPVLGVAGTTVGSLGFQNATSGTETITPATGALASGVATLPAGTYNLVGDSLTQTLTGKTITSTTNTLGTVTMGLGSDATGDIYYRNASGFLTRLPIGSSTNVLAVSGGLPAWTAPGAGGTVTSVAANAGVTSSPNPITTAGTVTGDGNYSGWATQNCALAASVSTNILTVTLTDNAGSAPSATSPCNINYRNVAAATGSTTLVQQTSTLSINTNTTGVTLGSSNNTAFRFWVVSFNNAGTNVLALINCSTATQVFPLNEAAPASALQIGAGATSAGVFYSQGLAITSKAFRIIGYVEYNATGLTTAGTYATGPNFIQTFGPGIKKPGDRVQLVPFTTNSTSSFTSSTFTVTVVTSSITPTSAANPILARVGGSARTQGAGTAGQLALRRGTTTNIATAFFAGVTNLRVPVFMEGFDLPNTASSQGYSVYMASSDNTTLVNFPENPANPAGVLILEEIQG